LSQSVDVSVNKNDYLTLYDFLYDFNLMTQHYQIIEVPHTLEYDVCRLTSHLTYQYFLYTSLETSIWMTLERLLSCRLIFVPYEQQMVFNNFSIPNIVSYGKNEHATYHAKFIEKNIENSMIRLFSQSNLIDETLVPFIDDYNMYNLCLAVAFAHQLNIEYNLDKIKISRGRMSISIQENYIVYDDRTPSSYQKMINNLELIEHMPYKKCLITSGAHENLVDYIDLNRNYGKLIGQIIDHVSILNAKSTPYIIEGIKNSKRLIHIEVYDSLDQALESYYNRTPLDTTILLINNDLPMM
ncbi:MAG: hypothetical protein RG740_07675, partial [Acholeplasmataceae bacterium]|nr:hypothetical protein [Acholeplasmataceae bacterium]